MPRRKLRRLQHLWGASLGLSLTLLLLNGFSYLGVINAVLSLSGIYLYYRMEKKQAQ